MVNEINNDVDDSKLSFEKVVENRINDPFWERVVIEYFRDELKETNPVVAKRLFKKISKYNDIYDEFIRCTMQKTYDLKNSMEVNGYTAKKISELNPAFDTIGVYLFLQLLRDNPEEAKEIINEGFPNKDCCR